MESDNQEDFLFKKGMITETGASNDAKQASDFWSTPSVAISTRSQARGGGKG